MAKCDFSMMIAKSKNAGMSYRRSNSLNILQIIKNYHWREPARALIPSSLVLGYTSCYRFATDRWLKSNRTITLYVSIGNSGDGYLISKTEILSFKKLSR